jgi:hypothetical protein
VFDVTKYNTDDPHIKVEGAKEYPSLKNLSGRDWNNDIQSVIMESGATVLTCTGMEIAFDPDQRIPDLSQLDMSITLNR